MANSTPDDDLKSVTAMAKRLKLEGRELEMYIHRHMTGLGHVARRTYVPADKNTSKSGGFFGGGDDDEDEI